MKILIIVAMVLVAVTASAQHPAPAGFTAPEWKAVITGAGVTPTYTDVPGDNPIRLLQIIETVDWVGTFWGVTYGGDTLQISPGFATDGDTSLTLPTGAAFTFYDTKLQWIQTHSGTAEFWGEK